MAPNQMTPGELCRSNTSASNLRPSVWLAKRSPESINKLLTIYRPLLRELAESHYRHRFHSKFDASDLVQETCSEAARSFDKLEVSNSKQFWGWLKRLLKNNFRTRNESTFRRKCVQYAAKVRTTNK